MKEVVDRIVQYPNRYKLTDVSTGKDMGTYDFTEVPGTVQQEGTEIDAELFDSIKTALDAKANSSDIIRTSTGLSDSDDLMRYTDTIIIDGGGV